MLLKAQNKLSKKEQKQMKSLYNKNNCPKSEVIVIDNKVFIIESVGVGYHLHLMDEDEVLYEGLNPYWIVLGVNKRSSSVRSGFYEACDDALNVLKNPDYVSHIWNKI